VLFGALLLNQAFNRADWTHFLPTTIVACVLLAPAFSLAVRLVRPAPLFTVLGLMVAGLIPTYLFVPLNELRAALQAAPPSDCAQSRGIERAGCSFVFTDQAAAAAFVNGITVPGERIFVGSTRHDRMFANDGMFYFLADRRNGTRYDDLVSGLARTRGTQETIVRELGQNKVNIVVLHSGFQHATEPNEGGRSSGLRLLDEHLQQDFRPIATVGNYAVWQRR
jgi:hypothetical protein